MKWTNVVACCAMAAAQVVWLFAEAHSVGGFVVCFFEVAWMLLQAFESFQFSDLDGIVDGYLPFMRHGLFRGVLLLVFGLWHISYGDWSYWGSILVSVGAILLLVAGVINIVIGSLQLANVL